MKSTEQKTVQYSSLSTEQYSTVSAFGDALEAGARWGRVVRRRHEERDAERHMQSGRVESGAVAASSRAEAEAEANAEARAQLVFGSGGFLRLCWRLSLCSVVIGLLVCSGFAKLKIGNINTQLQL